MMPSGPGGPTWHTTLSPGGPASPSLLGTILRDPRLGIPMAALAASPRLARRLFGPGR